jgi:hypothetical protein
MKLVVLEQPGKQTRTFSGREFQRNLDDIVRNGRRGLLLIWPDVFGGRKMVVHGGTHIAPAAWEFASCVNLDGRRLETMHGVARNIASANHALEVDMARAWNDRLAMHILATGAFEHLQDAGYAAGPSLVEFLQLPGDFITSSSDDTSYVLHCVCSKSRR